MFLNLLWCSQKGARFLVCDAGGSTVDTTAYVVQASEPELLLEEAKLSDCRLISTTPLFFLYSEILITPN